MSDIHQFKAVIKRNILLKYRSKCVSIFEILLPVFIMIGMIGIRLAVTREEIPDQLNEQYALTFNMSTTAVRLNQFLTINNYKLAFVPNNYITNQLISNLTNDYPLFTNKYKLFNTEDELVDYVESSDYSKFSTTEGIWAAVIFKQIGTNVQGNREWTVKIRMNATRQGEGSEPVAAVPDTRLLGATDDLELDYVSAHWLKYYLYGFSFLQTYTEEFILKHSYGNENNVLPTVHRIQPFPTRAHISDDFAELVEGFLGLLYTLAYIWPVTQVISVICEEKETKRKEWLKMSGLKEHVYQLTLLLTYLIIFALSAALIAATTSTTVFENSDKGLIFVFFLLFGINVYSFAVFISAFFSKARVASTMGAIIFLIAFFPYYVVADDDVSTGQKVAGCLSPTICFGLGAKLIAQLESAQQGLTYTSINNEVNNIRGSTIFIMLIVDALILYILGLYFDRIIPKEWGTPEKCCFCFSCCSKKKHNKKLNDDEKKHDDEITRNQDNVENVPEEMYSKLAVKVRHLGKEFGNDESNVPNFVAVHDLNLDMFDSEIFTLLGQNGAGKTTTINMLSGLYGSTRGYASMFNYDVNNEMHHIRKSMGVCPQHDLLYDELTVYEHFELFARMKGLGDKQLEDAIEKIIVDLGLTEKRTTLTKYLSGGQKRKCSLGCAFVGNSKLVFLDEPTSGMDVYSRRLTWDLLRKYKKDKVIILTTHFMDEADQLSDRIAILSHGRLKCCGSQLYLKKLYGYGYVMTIVKQAHADDRAIKRLLRNHIKDAELLSNSGGQISFRLKFEDAKRFPKLFDDLDSSMHNIGIESYSFSVTTLEEVFLRVDKGTIKEQQEDLRLLRDFSTSTKPNIELSTSIKNSTNIKSEQKQDSITEKTNNESSLKGKRDKSIELQIMDDESAPRFFRQIKALLYKRYHNTRRDRKQRAWTIIYPVAVVFFAVLLLKLAARTTFPEAQLNTAQYNSPNYVVYNQAPSFPIIPTHLNSKTQGGNSIPFDVNITTDREMSEYLLKDWNYAQSRYGAYNFKQLNSNVTTNKFTIFINTTGIHSYPVFLNLYHNMVHQEKSNGDPSAKINLIMQPLPLTNDQQSLVSWTLAILISIGYAFIPAAIGGFIVFEREVNAKHQQLISGVDITSYWISTYLWDIINYLLPASLSIIIIAIFNIKEMLNSATPVTILIILLYGISVAPFTYALSFLFKSHASAQNVLLMLYILTGSILMIVTIILWSISESTRRVQDTLIFFERLLPNYCFAEAISNLTLRKAQFAFGRPRTAWDFEVIGWPMIFMCIDTVLYFCIVFLIEKIARTPKWLLKLQGFNHDETNYVDEQDKTDNDDIDVINERKRIETEVSSDDACIIKDLRKVFPGNKDNPNKVAVRNMSLGIKENECFGLLGVNGAGKTTLIRILTGDILPTKGTAVMKGFDILSQQKSLRRLLGYCPQHDALIGTLTAREQLKLYAEIKGVKTEYVDDAVNNILKSLGLDDDGMADRPCIGYSGGNRRKLSVGISLIGNPKVLFLDEPSSGMDIKTRRFMWDLITSNMAGRSVILTSHSMEEVEALCSRIGIMVGGKLRCLGSSPHLKKRFGAGYQIDINTGRKTVSTVIKYFKSTFDKSDIQILERHANNIKYRIKPNVRSLGELFSLMEEKRNELNIDNYAISETTLEQIFIYFAKQQVEEQVMVKGITDAEDIEDEIIEIHDNDDERKTNDKDEKAIELTVNK